MARQQGQAIYSQPNGPQAPLMMVIATGETLTAKITLKILPLVEKDPNRPPASRSFDCGRVAKRTPVIITWKELMDNDWYGGGPLHDFEGWQPHHFEELFKKWYDSSKGDARYPPRFGDFGPPKNRLVGNSTNATGAQNRAKRNTPWGASPEESAAKRARMSDLTLVSSKAPRATNADDIANRLGNISCDVNVALEPAIKPNQRDMLRKKAPQRRVPDEQNQESQLLFDKDTQQAQSLTFSLNENEDEAGKGDETEDADDMDVDPSEGEC
ncbi:hypothetical protein BT63DRAFT_409925 [Microthyrium microscopicum]|uniref:Uncharacterized protein n=1 Tax=Microthyrium microscopicum TaxID=703497 RepID=A0A6A6UMD5_9PEZI|nr:hypothetical protein BT63DRAFT_409925 [Microthyrium microscopicum]